MVWSTVYRGETARPSSPASFVTLTPGTVWTSDTLPDLSILLIFFASFCVKSAVPSGRKSTAHASSSPLATCLGAESGAADVTGTAIASSAAAAAATVRVLRRDICTPPESCTPDGGPGRSMVGTVGY